MTSFHSVHILPFLCFENFCNILVLNCVAAQLIICKRKFCREDGSASRDVCGNNQNENAFEASIICFQELHHLAFYFGDSVRIFHIVFWKKN